MQGYEKCIIWTPGFAGGSYEFSFVRPSDHLQHRFLNTGSLLFLVILC